MNKKTISLISTIVLVSIMTGCKNNIRSSSTTDADSNVSDKVPAMSTVANDTDDRMGSTISGIKDRSELVSAIVDWDMPYLQGASWNTVVRESYYRGSLDTDWGHVDELMSEGRYDEANAYIEEKMRSDGNRIEVIYDDKVQFVYSNYGGDELTWRTYTDYQVGETTEVASNEWRYYKDLDTGEVMLERKIISEWDDSGKKCISTAYLDDGTSYLSALHQYNESGELLKYEYYNSDGSLSSGYDQQCVSIDENRSAYVRCFFGADAHIEEIEYYGYCDFVKNENYERCDGNTVYGRIDPRGFIAKKVVKYEGENSASKSYEEFYTYEGNVETVMSSRYDGVDLQKTVRIFNEQGNILSENRYNILEGGEMLISSVEYTYATGGLKLLSKVCRDYSGMVTEETQNEWDGSAHISIYTKYDYSLYARYPDETPYYYTRVVSEYDSEGRLLVERHYEEKMLDRKTEYTYEMLEVPEMPGNN